MSYMLIIVMLKNTFTLKNAEKTFKIYRMFSFQRPL